MEKHGWHLDNKIGTTISLLYHFKTILPFYHIFNISSIDIALKKLSSIHFLREVHSPPGLQGSYDNVGNICCVDCEYILT